MNEFITWATLATYGGALAMVVVLTQLTKGLPGIIKVPTQLWSYLLSLVVVVLGTYFTIGLTMESGILTIFNAAIISLAANGGYEVVTRALGGGK